MPRFLAALLCLALLAAPAVASACPYCAANMGNTGQILLLLAAFLTFPFALVGLVAWIVRRLAAEELTPLKG